MKFITLVFLCLIGGALCFDWRGTLFSLDEEDGIDFMDLALENPVLYEYVDAFTKFYEGILLTPKGFKLLDKWADVLDLVSTHNYNWTLIDIHLNSHELPGVQDLMISFMASIDGGKKNPLFEYQMNTIKYLMKADTEFQGLILRELAPLFVSPEMESLVRVMKDPLILSEFIELAVNMTRISSDFLIDLLLTLKEGLGDYGSSGDSTISEVFEALRSYEEIW